MRGADRQSSLGGRPASGSPLAWQPASGRPAAATRSESPGRGADRPSLLPVQPSVATRGEPLRVTHVITGLELGGAEMMLYKLLGAIDHERFDPTVISLSTFGPLAQRIAGLGIPVSALGMSPGLSIAHPPVRPLARLARRLSARRPQVVHTWMYHADLLGGALARASSDAKVIWGVRGSLDAQLSKRSSLLTARACALSSRWLPDRIVSCSQRLAEIHVEFGYDPTRMLVIPNGFDLSLLAPDEALRMRTRERLGATEGELLVGNVGRYHPQKDHRAFVRAAGEIARERPDVRFVLCGPGVDRANGELMGWIAQAGIAGRCELLGPVEDPRGVLNALDVLVCSSAFGEGFPNVLGEAMACGVTCVTTDVGDAATIVGDTGRVVAARDWRALADAVLAVLSLSGDERRALGEQARTRVRRNYALERVVGRFEALYLELCAGG
jgi:glycosyltransferase involved in cell wall biosynthesis